MGPFNSYVLIKLSFFAPPPLPPYSPVCTCSERRDPSPSFVNVPIFEKETISPPPLPPPACDLTLVLCKRNYHVMAAIIHHWNLLKCERSDLTTPPSPILRETSSNIWEVTTAKYKVMHLFWKQYKNMHVI